MMFEKLIILVNFLSFFQILRYSRNQEKDQALEQPSWLGTVWKFQNSDATEILREIKFGNFRDSKTAILAILEALGSINIPKMSKFWED